MGLRDRALPTPGRSTGIFLLFARKSVIIPSLRACSEVRREGDVMVSRKRWTDREREYLSVNCAHKSRAELAQHFGVSVHSIAHQLSRMGLTKANKWDERRNQYLRDNYLILTNKQLAQRLNTTPVAINNRLIRMGLRRSFRWTPEAEQLLRENILQKSDREMADALLTTPESVTKKLRRMKLKRPPRKRRTDLPE